MKKITKGWLVYRALTGMNRKTCLPIAARTAFICLNSGCLKIVMSSRDQPERLCGVADPAPHGGVAVEMETALMRQPCVGQ